jgi:hypothetical protein
VELITEGATLTNQLLLKLQKSAEKKQENKDVRLEVGIN